MTWTDINTLVLRILNRWWVVVIIAAVVIGAAGWRMSTTAKTYRTTTFMVVNASSDLNQADYMRVYGFATDDVVLATFSDIFTSPKVVGPAMEASGVWPGDWVDYHVTAFREPSSGVLRLTVEGADPNLTVALTDAVMTRGTAVLAEQFPIFVVDPLTNGVPVAAQVSLPWTRAMALAGMIGVGLGVLIALWFDSLMSYRRASTATRAAAGGATVELRSSQTQQVAPLRRQ